MMQKRLKKKDINLLHASVMIEKRKHEKDKKKIVLIIIPIVMALVILCIIAGMLIRTSSYRHQKAEIDRYMVSPEISGKQEKLNVLTQELDTLSKFESKFNNVENTLKMQNEINKKALSKIFSLTKSDVTLKSVNYDHEMIMISAQGKTQRSPGQYVARLRKAGIFQNILYSGYTLNDGTYEFSVTLSLSPEVEE